MLLNKFSFWRQPIYKKNEDPGGNQDMTGKLGKVIQRIQEKSERFSEQKAALNWEIRVIEQEMENLNDQLVDLHLEGDASGQAQHIKKKLKDFTLQLTEKEAQRESYNRISQKGLIGEKERREIKAIIDKESLLRSSNLEKILEEKQRTQQKIEELQNKLKTLDADYNLEHGGRERQFMQMNAIITEIHPKAAGLRHSERMQFLKSWVESGDVSAFADEPKSVKRRTEVVDLGPKVQADF